MQTDAERRAVSNYRKKSIEQVVMRFYPNEQDEAVSNWIKSHENGWITNQNDTAPKRYTTRNAVRFKRDLLKGLRENKAFVHTPNKRGDVSINVIMELSVTRREESVTA